MDGGMEEIFCSSCSHKDVCVYKDVYLNMVNSLVETFYKSNKNDIEFMDFRDPLCRFYSKESSTPRLFAQRVGIPEDMALTILDDGRKSCAKMIAAAEAVQNFNRKTDV